jgi:hypothetical protein
MKSLLTTSVLALTLLASGASFAKDCGRSGDGNPKNNASPTVVTQKPVFVYQDGAFVVNPAR